MVLIYIIYNIYNYIYIFMIPTRSAGTQRTRV